jgi:predicted transcriptional regulator
MTWTKQVVADPSLANAHPKTWFDSKQTAKKAIRRDAKRVPDVTPETLIKLLSKDNLRLLAAISTQRPASMKDLAALMNRRESNVSRTLKKLRTVGIVDFEIGERRRLIPKVIARKITLSLDLVGDGSSVEVDASETAA